MSLKALLHLELGHLLIFHEFQLFEVGKHYGYLNGKKKEATLALNAIKVTPRVRGFCEVFY